MHSTAWIEVENDRANARFCAMIPRFFAFVLLLVIIVGVFSNPETFDRLSENLKTVAMLVVIALVVGMVGCREPVLEDVAKV